jgi:mannosyltransferase OCH1-like enzyme
VFTEYGGVYLDMDHLILRSLDDLLNNSAVIGRAIRGFNCGNGFLVMQRRAPYLEKWIANYTDFKDAQWAEHSTIRWRHISV